MEKQDERGPTMFSVRELLDERKCSELIAQTERRGYVVDEESNPKGGAECVWEDAELAELLWMRVSGLRCSAGHHPSPASLKPRMYTSRCDPGQGNLSIGGKRDPTDEERDPNRLTLLLHLNEEFTGGETVCYLFDGPVRIQPERGLALLFPSHLTYEELPVRTGRKYLLHAEILAPCSECGES